MNNDLIKNDKSKKLVIGYFGYHTNKLDGQTVKTRNLYALVAKHFNDVSFFDTQEFRFSKKSILKMFYAILKADQLIYLPAHGNLKYLFPLIWLMCRFNHSKIYYFIIGGWLSLFVRNLPIHRFMLKRISGIYSETKRLKKELNEWYGMNNVHIFNNFRSFDFCPVEHHISGELHLVFMARVCRQKGLDMIFKLGDFLSKTRNMYKISIDFYGQIIKEDEDFFRTEISRFPFMEYKGVLQPNNIYEVLQKYDALILPTHYPREGLPGSVVDAYISGIPVIVTNWAYAEEFVENGKTGLIVPYEDGQKELNDAVLFLLSNENDLHEMKLNAYQRAFQFSEKVAWEQLKNILD